MQNCIPNSANNDGHHNWYGNMFAANIKTEPGTQPDSQPAPSFGAFASDTYPNYYKQHQQHQQQNPFMPMDAAMISLTPSPTNNQNLAGGSSEQQSAFFDNTNTGMQQQLIHQQQYQQHFQQGQKAAAQNQLTAHFPLGFNPLTPPGLPQAVLPTISQFYNRTTQKQEMLSPRTLLESSAQATLTPSHTPPMDITPPKSPKPRQPKKQQKSQKRARRSRRGKRLSTDQESMTNSSQYDKTSGESEEDENIHMPKYNSHGRLKNYKCKNCGMVSFTKINFWRHTRTHMRPDKILECTKCPFVTELKHHLEYHVRKHSNLKPFKCEECSYTCVNKSMLNSHLKSHSSVYPYRCITCTYTTKYCHSFKVHLRKYAHKQDVVLDDEGVPNPSLIIDVYGTRRGPKNKRSAKKKSNAQTKALNSPQLAAALQRSPEPDRNEQPSTSAAAAANDLAALTVSMSLRQQHEPSNSQMLPSQQPAEATSQDGSLSHMLPPLATFLQQNPSMRLLPYWSYNFQFLAQQHAAWAQLSPTIREQLQNFHTNENLLLREVDKSNDEDGHDGDNDAGGEQAPEENDILAESAMDLSQGSPTRDENRKQTPDLAINLKLPAENIETPVLSNRPKKSRRKGRVLKLEQNQLKNDGTISPPASPCSPEPNAKIEMPSSSSSKASTTKIHNSPSADNSMEMDTNQINNTPAPAPTSTSTTFTASSSGNSSNSSSTSAFNSNNFAPTPSTATTTPTMFECKYCDIFFKDAVLYTIHMGYHSCDDVFKCNMCGEKCDGPVGLFVHMARNAHS